MLLYLEIWASVPPDFIAVILSVTYQSQSVKIIFVRFPTFFLYNLQPGKTAA